MKRTALLLSLLLPLAACNQTTPTSDTSATTPANSAATTPSAAAEAAAAEAAAGGNPAPAATTPAVDPAAATAVADIAKAASSTALVPGTDYAEIQGGQPFDPRNGKVEVVEVFGYVCPACFKFQPLVSAWEKTLPADVRFTLPGEGKKPDEAAIAKFYGRYGADPKQFADAMHSFAVDAKLNRGKQFMTRGGVQGTPTIIVDGKYRVIGKSYDDMLRITNQLIAQERAAGAHP
jgi:thiol:disulfide interchange protein DsbA